MNWRVVDGRSIVFQSNWWVICYLFAITHTPRSHFYIIRGD